MIGLPVEIVPVWIKGNDIEFFMVGWGRKALLSAIVTLSELLDNVFISEFVTIGNVFCIPVLSNINYCEVRYLLFGLNRGMCRDRV